MRRFALIGLLALGTAACGGPSVRPVTAPIPVRAAASQLQAENQLQGAYLSVDLRPHLALFRQARTLRMQLGFIDMGQALPPRPPGDFHMTVAYFQNLSRNSAQKLAELFQKRSTSLEVTGWGVAKDQAAYFTVAGIDAWRSQIKAAIPESFSATDPHLTFGVHPDKRKDVHGVPKPQQHTLPAMRVTGDVHLKQGDAVLW